MAQWNERPRSVRQIGSPERSCRVYLEDYADTYIRRIPADGPQGVHAGALYGRKMVQDGLQCYYIFGAVETEPVWEDARLRFGQKAWKKIEQMRQNYFPTMDVCGWFVRTEEDFMPDTEQLQRVQDTFFAETGEILYTVAGEEGTFFRKGQSLLYPLQGYYVFYQNNTAMQEYLAQTGSRQKSGVRLESLRERPPQKTQNQTPQEAAKPAAQSAQSSPGSEEETASAGIWQRRFAAAALFVLLAAGIVFYGHPDRAQALQKLLARGLFGTEEAVPAAGEAAAEETEQPESAQETEESGTKAEPSET